MGSHLFDIDPSDPGQFAWLVAAGNRHYMAGYEEAIDILLAATESHEGRSNTVSDRLVYPIAFLSRHLVELRLKSLIEAGNRRLGTTEQYQGHNLVMLLESCVNIAQIQWPNTTFDALESNVLIHELDRVDARSTSFRYATNRSGQRSLPEELQKFNLRVFVESMRQVNAILAGLETGIEETE